MHEPGGKAAAAVVDGTDPKKAADSRAGRHVITIKSDDSVVYSKIISTMDVAVGASFKDIGVQDKGQGN